MHRQLTFDVIPRVITNLRGEQRPAEVLASELTIKGEFRLGEVALEHGDELHVTIAGADGEVITSVVAEVSAPPSFVPIEEKDIGLIGYTRAHKAKLTT